MTPEWPETPEEKHETVIKVDTSAVSIKLPPFWPADSELWLAQVEAQFAIRNITTQITKFNHVVGSLSPDVATEVRDILLNPDPNNPYDQLKAALSKRTAISEEKRLRELLSSEEIGDRKPSQVLRRMQQLAGGQAVDQKLMRSLFLQKLPTSVQQIAAAVGDKVELSELAEMADSILEVTGGAQAHVSAVSENPVAVEINQLKEDMAELKTMFRSVLELSNNPQGRGRSSNRGGRSSSRGRSPFHRGRDASKYPLCWYHWKFRENATRCEQPCAWTSSSGNGSAGQG